MDAHRSRSLGMATLVFILISLTAAVFHGAAPVRAEDATLDYQLYPNTSHIHPHMCG